MALEHNSLVSSKFNGLIDSKFNSFSDDAPVFEDTVQLESYWEAKKELVPIGSGSGPVVANLGPMRAIHTKKQYEYLANVGFRSVDRATFTSTYDRLTLLTTFDGATWLDTQASHAGWTFKSGFPTNLSAGHFLGVGPGPYDDPFTNKDYVITGQWDGGSGLSIIFFGTTPTDFPPIIRGMAITRGLATGEVMSIIVFATPFQIFTPGVFISAGVYRFSEVLRIYGESNSSKTDPYIAAGQSPNIYRLVPEDED